DGQRLERLAGRLDEQRAVRAHRERGAKLRLPVEWSDGACDDLVRVAALPNPQGFLERDLVERVQARFHAVGRDTGAVGPHSNGEVVVDDAFDADEELACFTGHPVPAVIVPVRLTGV